MLKRMMCLFLSAVMVLTMVPAQAFAEEITEETAVMETTAVPEIPEESESVDSATESTSAPVEKPTEIPETTVETTEAAEETTEAAEETAAVTEESTKATEESTEATEETAEPTEETTETTEESAEPTEETTESAAVEIMAEGTCGENLTWKLDSEGTLTISGSGAMADYTAEDPAPWTEWKEQIAALEIEEGVTSIGDYAFYGYAVLCDAQLPDGLQRIGRYALSGCTELWSLDVPCGVETIEEGAFSASGLWTISLPESLTEISDYTFRDCALGSIAIPNGVERIGTEAFAECANMENTLIPASVTVIESNAFKLTLYGCNYYTITFLGSAPDIAEDAFTGSRASVYYPTDDSSWTEDVKRAYGGSLTWMDEVTVSGRCGTGVTWVFDTETGIMRISGTGAMTEYSTHEEVPWFHLREQIQKIEIGEGITKIGAYAFMGSAVSEISISSTVMYIGPQAFASCHNLRSVVIPENVKDISGAFHACVNLSSVTLSEGLERMDDTFSFCPIPEIEIPSTVRSIGAAFSYNHVIRSITLPEGVTAIGGGDFVDCSSLSTVVIPESVSYIHANAFYGCSSLEELVLPSGIDMLGSTILIHTGIQKIVFKGDAPSSIAEDCFEGVTATVYYPAGDDSWTTVIQQTYGGSIIWQPYETENEGVENRCGEHATWYFDEATGKLTIQGTGAMYEYTSYYHPVKDLKDHIVTVEIEEGITSISSWLFYDCKKLTSVSIPDTVTEIGEWTFLYCGNLADVTVPKSVETIRKGAFGGVQSVYLESPENLRYIGESAMPSMIRNEELVFSSECYIDAAAFSQCSGLKRVTIPEGTGAVEFHTFAYCPDLESVTFPGSLKVIGDLAFHECDMLSRLVFPENLESIGTWAFARIENLQEIHFLGDACSIGELAFEDVTATVYYPAGNATWTEEVRQDYGGNLTWVATGAEIVAEGTCGDNLTWTLDSEGTLIISGTGPMYKYTSYYSAAPWYNTYRTDIVRVIIEDGVTQIGDYAFQSCTNLNDVSISDTVTGICQYAFGHCGKLTELTIPVGITSISESAFAHCTSLERFYADENNTAYDTNECGALYNKSRTTLLKVPNTYEGTYQIEEGVTHIADFAFCSCDEISGVTIPDSVRSVGAFGFYGCNKITEVNIPEGVSRIGEETFAYCNALTEITLPSTLTNIETEAFTYCKNLLGVEIPDRVVNIGARAFSNCWQLSNVKLPSKLKNISNGMFKECDSLETVIIPDSVTKIDVAAFEGCSKLKSIIIPENVTSIESEAFGNCFKLKEIIFMGNAPTIATDKTYSYGAFRQITATAYYPAGNSTWVESVMQDYGGTITWLPYSPTIASGICGDDLVWTLTEAGTLTISGTGEMYDWAEDEVPWYDQRDSIVRLVLEEGMTSIGDFAFCRCPITEVTLPSSVTDIGYNAFSFTNLETLTVPATVRSIDVAAFQGCEKLTAVTLEEGLETLCEGAFGWCTALTEITIPASVTKIEPNPFGNSGITAITVADGNLNYVSVDGVVFSRDMSKLLIFPAGWAETSYTVPDSVKEIGYCAFDGAVNLASIELPEGLEIIGGSAFLGCEGLTEITFPESLKKISICAFSGCEAEKVFVFQGNAPEFDEYAFDGVTAVAYYPVEDATWTEEVRQNYGGSITWMPSSYVELRKAKDTDYILSGKTLQVYAYQMPDDIKISATWAITSGSDYASVSTGGLITAKSVTEVQTITVTATPKNGVAAASMTLKVLPADTALTICDELAQPLGDTLTVDMREIPELLLTALLEGVDAPCGLSWSTSSSTIAVVENGMVTFKKPGTVTITAKEIYGIKDTVKITVTYLDSAKTLMAETDAPEIGLQIRDGILDGESCRMLVYGENKEIPLDPEYLSFTSSDETMARVDETGCITAVSKTGTVKITAAIAGDPLGRKVTLSVKIIPAQIQTLTLIPETEGMGEILPVYDDAGDFLRYEVTLNKGDLKGEAWTFAGLPEAFNAWGDRMALTAESLRWTSGDTALAVLSVREDGSAEVTVQADADGSCTIAAVSTDLTGASADMILRVRDLSPRLASSQITLNPMLEAGTDVGLVESYGNSITDVAIRDARLGVGYDGEKGILSVYALEPIVNCTINTVLDVTCADGNTYSFDLKVTVKNVSPTVTVTQSQKMDLFYTDSEATLSVTASNCAVTGVELADTEDFALAWHGETGTLTFSDSYLADHSTKPDTAVTLKVWLEGYQFPVEKTFTISTVTSTMRLTSNPTSSVINTALSQDYSVCFQVLNSVTKEALPLADIHIQQIEAGCDVEYYVSGDGQVHLSLAESVATTATVWVKLDNWMNGVKLTHKITVSSSKPTVKLGESTLKLSTVFTEHIAQTSVSLSQANLALSSFSNGNVFVTTAAEGTATWTEASKILVYYDGSSITAQFADPGDLPKAGTYSFSAVPDIDGTELTKVTVRVNVSAAVPTAKLSAATLKLNTFFYDPGTELSAETAETVVTLTNSTGLDLQLVGFEELLDWADENVLLDFDSDTGGLYAMLISDETAKYTFRLTPIVRDNATGQEVTMSGTVSLTVQAYSNSKVTISQTASGKLDAIVPDSAIVYTISRITNALGQITDVQLAETNDGELFELAGLGISSAGKQTVTLKMREGVTYATNVTYKVQFRYEICGVWVDSAVLSFRVSQSNLTLTAPVCRYYMSQSTPLRISVNLTAPAGASIGTVAVNTAKTSRELLEALKIGEGLEFTDFEDSTAVVLTFPVESPESLTAGKTYTLYLTVMPANCASNVSAKQIAVSVAIAG